MNKLFAAALMLGAAVLSWGPATNAQHTDVQFFYEDGQINLNPDLLIDRQNPGSSAGNNASDGEPLVFVGTFPTAGNFFQQFTITPGFASESDAGAGIGANDEIFYHVLDDLVYWDPTTQTVTAPPAGHFIEVRHFPSTVGITTIDEDSGVQLGGNFGSDGIRNRIGAANGSGEFHTDLDWRLLPTNLPSPSDPNAFGLYGVRLQLTTTAAGIEDSDPFYFGFNLGLGSADLALATAAFEDLLPPAVLGDYDRSGESDINDVSLFLQQFGTIPIAPGSGADGNGDDIVNAADYTILRDSFLLPTAAAVGSPNVSATPEPSSAMILAGLACGLLTVGGRRERTTNPCAFMKSKREETPMA